MHVSQSSLSLSLSLSSLSLLPLFSLSLSSPSLLPLLLYTAVSLPEAQKEEGRGRRGEVEEEEFENAENGCILYYVSRALRSESRSVTDASGSRITAICALGCAALGCTEPGRTAGVATFFFLTFRRSPPLAAVRREQFC